jgi:ankyrin repeat protein
MKTTAKIVLLLLPVILFSGVECLGQISSRKAQNLVSARDTNKLNILIKNGLDINATYRSQKTLLHYAVEHRAYDMVKFLVGKGANVNLRDKNKSTPLLAATSLVYRNDSIARYLLDKGADPNVMGSYGITALRNVIGIYGGQDSVLFRLLIDKGADANQKCEECCNRTAFLYCCGWGTPGMVQLILNKKIDIDQIDCEGENGLIYAVAMGNTEVVKLLLKTSIDKNHKDNKGLTALDYAINTGNKNIVELFRQN